MPSDGLRLASHIGIGILCVAASAALAGAAVFLPGPQAGAGPAATTVTPAPVASVDVCPGPPLAVGASGGADSVSPLASTRLTAGREDGSGVTVDALTGADGRRDTGDAPSAVTPQHSTSSAPGGIAAAQSSEVTSGGQSDGGVAGFAAAQCTQPASDSWIVAGATTLGQNSLLLLANPSAAAVAVTVSIWGVEGPVTTQAGSLTVPARTQRAVPLSGLAPDAGALTVHVHAGGPGIAASIQQSLIQGLTPRGIALAGPGTAPAGRQVIPGVLVSTLSDLQKAQAGEGYGVDLPAVRILNTGATAAQVNVGVVGETGTKAGNAYTATIGAQKVAEIPLTGLTDGDYTVTVSSNTPVAAAVRTAVQGARQRNAASGDPAASHSEDFTWFEAAPQLSGTTSLAVADGPGSRVHLVNTQNRTAQAALTGGGHTTTVTVPAGGATSVALPSGIYTLAGLPGGYASVGYAGAGQISSYPVSGPAAQDSPLRVYTGG